MAVETQDRWTEIRKLHVDWKDAYRILGGVVLVGIGVVIGAGWFANPQADGYTTNLYTEFISIAITVFILDFLNRRRDDRRRIEDLKAQLLRQVRNPEPTVRNNAIHEIRERRWLTGEDGLLRGADLNNANLREAPLSEANLEETFLFNAYLQEAYMTEATLRKARLSEANMRGAVLFGVNFEQAIMWLTNLQGANLRYANLQGAKLYQANLQMADLMNAVFDNRTLLPDAMTIGFDKSGKQVFHPDSYYKPGITDMRRYTDPAHPDFWQPDWAKGQGGGG